MGQVDPESTRKSPRPRIHWHRVRGILSLAALVAVGSTFGTLLRAVIEEAFPAAPGGWPWATFGINMVGSFLLGALLETLSRAGDDTGWRRLARLGIGTGVIGGFTTYSTYVVEVDKITRVGYFPTAASYALISLVLGIAAAAAGLAVVSAIARTVHAKEQVK